MPVIRKTGKSSVRLLMLFALILIGINGQDASGRGHIRTHNDPEEMRARMMELQKQVDHLTQKSLDLAKQAYGVDRKSIRAPFGRFLLMRSGGTIAAVKIVRHTQLSTATPSWAPASFSGAEYVCYVQNGESFSNDAQEFRGEVSAAAPLINCGSIALRWHPGDWIELPDDKSFFAVSEFVELSEIKVRDPILQWIDLSRLRRILSGRDG